MHVFRGQAKIVVAPDSHASDYKKIFDDSKFSLEKELGV